MKTPYARLAAVSALLTTVLSVASCGVLGDVQALKTPRYEAGKHRGAQYCRECHRDLYDQWVNRSRHAVANTGESFHAMREKFSNHWMLNLMMGESMCYACHGSQEAAEGVNCETCHGAAANAPIEETHERKFRPGLAKLRQADFCAKCHEMKNPMSGSAIMSVYGEWEQSEAARKGLTCQGCHMRPEGNGLRYHGFDTARRNTAIYEGDLDLREARLHFPQLSLRIDNRVTGHAVPASCGTRLLVLEVVLLDEQREVAHTLVRGFTKINELMGGLMPYRVLENTQLQAGESRLLTFTLPPHLHGRIRRAVMSLRFYEVPDEHRGDLSKANWVGEPFLKKEVRFSEGRKEDSQWTTAQEN